MSDLHLLAATLLHAHWALVSHRGHLYGLSGRGMWRVTSVEMAASALHPSRWGQA